MKTLLFIHVAISLVGIGSGFVVLYGLLTTQRMKRWTALFLATTLATTLTGFLFPFKGFTPAIGTGIVSLIVLIPAILALYRYRLAGAWRWIYVVGSVSGLYLNVFVLIVQAFQKVPALRALAPTQTEAPFAAAQLTTLVLFIVFGTLAVKKFRIGPDSFTTAPA
jgi:hypothetical protein